MPAVAVKPVAADLFLVGREAFEARQLRARQAVRGKLAVRGSVR